MGLSIQYTLTAPPETDAARVKEMVHALRRFASDLQYNGRLDHVGQVTRDTAMHRWCEEFLSYPCTGLPGRHHEVSVRPLDGWVFVADPGRNCETMTLGLYRYPLTVRVEDRLVRTNLRGWRLKHFCKTQYAGQEGWEHFLRCHKAVIELLEGAKALGFGVEINDEGGYWPGRNVRKLRRNLGEVKAPLHKA